MYDKKNLSKKIALAIAINVLAIVIPFNTTYAGPGGAIEPAVSTGITIVPLDQQAVPQALRHEAKLALIQMKSRGYVDATEDEVSYLDRAKEDKHKRLKPMIDVAPKLKLSPANLGSSSLSQAVLLGATANGGHTAEGWTGLTRIFALPKLGLVGLNEVDYVASKGGMAFIKEAINQSVNGYAAILSVKQSRSGKGLTELTWATDRKIYTLSTNSALKNQTSIDEFMAIARGIF